MKKKLLLLASIIIILVLSVISVSANDNTDYSKLYTYTVKNNTVTIKEYKGKERKVTIPSEINGRKVTEIGVFAFYGKRNIRELTIPGTVKTISKEAFAGLHNLKTLTLKKGIEIIGENAFSNCFKLQSVTIPSSVKEIGDRAFEDCKKLKKVKLRSKTLHIGANILSGTKYSSDKNNIENGIVYLKNYVISARQSEVGKILTFRQGTEYIAPHTFSNYDSIKEVVIPGTVKYIGTCAFDSCWRLTKVTLEKGVEEIAECAFIDCIRLKKITLPDSVEKIGDYALGYRYSDNINLPMYIPVENFKLFCSYDTEAEKYAKENKLTFKHRKPENPEIKVTGLTKKIRINYAKTDDIDGIQVEYTLKNKTKAVNCDINTDTAKKNITNLKKGIYKVRVRSFIKADKQNIYSDWLTFENVKVK